ncbi:MAG: hypothetical protein U0792_18440 [Gemmataceae bacterium]
MFASLTRRMFLAVVAAAVLVLTTGQARADNQTKKDDFQLTRGDFTELKFVPGAPGLIKAGADFKGTGLVKSDIALRLQLVRPDGSVAKETIGGNPLPLSFTLSPAEFAQNKGKAYKLVLRHTVAGQADEKVKGSLSVTFPIATVTIFNNSANPIDLGGKGSKTEVSFQLPNTPGKLEVAIDFRDGLLNGKDLIAQLIRADGVVVTATTGDSGLKLIRNVTQADLDKGLTWKVRFTNNGASTVKGIKLLAKYTTN